MKVLSILTIILSPLLFISCQQKSSKKDNLGTRKDNTYQVAQNKITYKTPNKDVEENYAIGNIQMNTSEEQFEKEKQLFLEEHSKLGGLNINTMKGFFYKGRLAIIEIISEQQEIHKNNPEATESYEGWYKMYSLKYQHANIIKDRIHPFSLEKDAGGLPLFLKKQFLIEVSDYCNSPKSHQSFEDVIISPKKECYGHNLAPFKFDESNNLMRAASVYSLISELPKERAEIVTRQYQLERAQISNDNLMAKITYEVAIDTKYYNILLPEAQAHRNRQLNLHKNDPSWSFIIIYYKPLLQKYNAEQEVIKQKKNIEKEKELDII